MRFGIKPKFISFLAISAVFLLSAGFAYAAPSISSISPTSKNVGSAQFTLTVNGSNFNSASVVRFNGSNRATTYVSSTQIRATVPAPDMLAAGTNAITVFNASGNTGTSGSKTFTVNNLVPTISSLSQTSAMAGDAAFTISVYGTNFVSTSVVQWAGSSRTTTYVSPTQLDAQIVTSDLVSGGSFSVTVANPTPGGGTSGAQTVTVNNPVPTLDSISPDYANGGGGSLLVTVTGSGFVPTSIAQFDYANKTTAYISPTELSVTIDSNDVASSQQGSHDIVVVNESPGGGTSNMVTFQVLEQHAPNITTIEPNMVTFGDGGFTLHIYGDGFYNGNVSTIYWGNLALPTEFISSSELTTDISATPSAGVYYLSVQNNNSSGGPSNTMEFTVYNAPPTAGDLAVSSNFCPVSEATGLAIFSWEYNDLDGDNQQSFQLQIDNDADFSSPAVDRTYDGLANPPETQNQQAVNIIVNGDENDSLTYNKTYHWRVRVCQYHVDPSQSDCFDWVERTYATISHPGPYVTFTASDTSPGVTFTNASTCYNVSGATACASYLYNFGDTTSFLKNNPAQGTTTTTHTYKNVATYDVAVVATDSSGLQCQAIQPVNVSNQTANGLPYWKETNPFLFNPPPACSDVGAICTFNSDCCSGACSGTCLDNGGGCFPIGHACTSEAQCCPGSSCLGGYCGESWVNG